jgi:hypothetical protein
MADGKATASGGAMKTIAEQDASAINVDGREIGKAAEVKISVENPLAETIRAEIAAWFVERIHDSPVSRDTAIVNYTREAVKALEDRLIARLAR